MSAQHIYNGNVIDFEASGFSPDSYPIEVGLVLDDGTIYHSLISPADEWSHWSSTAEKCHGIRRKDAKKFGKKVAQVCLELNEICGNQTLFSDCWVRDSDWLSKLFLACGIKPTFYISPIEYCLNDSQLENWGHKKQEVAKEENMPIHRAMSDAYIIRVLMDRLVLGEGRNTIVEIDDVCSPIFIHTCRYELPVAQTA